MTPSFGIGVGSLRAPQYYGSYECQYRVLAEFFSLGMVPVAVTLYAEYLPMGNPYFRESFWWDMRYWIRNNFYTILLLPIGGLVVYGLIEEYRNPSCYVSVGKYIAEKVGVNPITRENGAQIIEMHSLDSGDASGRVSGALGWAKENHLLNIRERGDDTYSLGAFRNDQNAPWEIHIRINDIPCSDSVPGKNWYVKLLLPSKTDL